MSAIRRNKIFTPDAQTVRFLYLILKQLDLKTVNWQDVADNIGIKNGHAARMRWSRFKQQAEGTPTQPKAPKAKKNDGDKVKGKRDREGEGNTDADRNEKRMKAEHGALIPNIFPVYPPYPPLPFPMPPQFTPEPSVKQEPILGFPQEFNASTTLTPAAVLRQPEPSPSTDIVPLSMEVNHPQPFAFPTEPDDAIDDITIKQLNSKSEATVSMNDLQPAHPIKPEPEDRPKESGVVASKLLTIDRVPTNCEQVPPFPPPTACQQPQLTQCQSPQLESGRTEGSGDIPDLASASALRNEMTPIPFTPAWIAPSNGSISSSYPPHYPGHSSHPPPPYPQPFQARYGHPPPTPMNYHRRPMLNSFWPADPYANQTAPTHPHAFPQQKMSMPSTSAIVPSSRWQASHFQAPALHPTSSLPSQTDAGDKQQTPVENDQDENQISIPAATTANPQCLTRMESPSAVTAAALNTATTPIAAHVCPGNKLDNEASDQTSSTSPQRQSEPQPTAFAHQQILPQHLLQTSTPSSRPSHNVFVPELAPAPIPCWIQSQNQPHYHIQHLHQPPIHGPMQSNPFAAAINTVGSASHQHAYHRHEGPYFGGGPALATHANTATTSAPLSFDISFPLEPGHEQGAQQGNEQAQHQDHNHNHDHDHEDKHKLVGPLPMTTPGNGPMNVPMNPQFLIPSPNSEEV